jgi:hypothetical protein
MAIYTLSSHLLETLERCNHAVGIFCDLTKGFDCVSHDILLSKLAIFGDILYQHRSATYVCTYTHSVIYPEISVADSHILVRHVTHCRFYL